MQIIGRHLAFTMLKGELMETMKKFVDNIMGKIVLGEEVISRPLECKDVNDLIKAGFPFTKGALNPSLWYKIFQLMKLVPNAERLIAYYVGEKRAKRRDLRVFKEYS